MLEKPLLFFGLGYLLNFKAHLELAIEPPAIETYPQGKARMAVSHGC